MGQCGAPDFIILGQQEEFAARECGDAGLMPSLNLSFPLPIDSCCGRGSKSNSLNQVKLTQVGGEFYNSPPTGGPLALGLTLSST